MLNVRGDCTCTSPIFQSRSMPVRGKGSMSGYFKGVDKKMAHIILDEIIDSGPCVRFNHIGKKLRLVHCTQF